MQIKLIVVVVFPKKSRGRYRGSPLTQKSAVKIRFPLLIKVLLFYTAYRQLSAFLKYASSLTQGKSTSPYCDNKTRPLSKRIHWTKVKPVHFLCNSYPAWYLGATCTKTKSSLFHLRPSLFFSSFSVECVSWVWVGRSVGRSNEKSVKRNHKMSENRRLKPQAVPWSLETTRHGHQMDTNSILQKIWWLMSW